MENNFISVSICMITYNHESFIRKAIEGVLMQKTNFCIELIIGDDCSTDNTITLINELIKGREKEFKLLSTTNNMGMMSNFIRTLTACSGKYIAICEGDDYWTDPNKLQKQFNFMEQHLDYSLCFHNATIINEVKKTSKLFAEYSKSDYAGKDILEKWLIPTASVFFRNVLPKEFPAFIKEATHGDLALFMFLSEFGKARYINEVMSVYRINSIGVTQSAFKGIQHNLKHVRQIELMNEYFGEKYKSLLNKRTANYLISTAYLQAKEGDKNESKQLLIKAYKINEISIFKHLKHVLGAIYHWFKF